MIIAISETIGSLGNEIGRHLAQELSWEFADREILAKAATRYGEGVMDLAHVTEAKPTLWERFTDTKRRYLTYVEATLFELAARDNVILSGRGATILLAPIRHALRVRVTAPERTRAERVEAEQGVLPEAALDLVRATDAERTARVRYLYHGDWDDPLLYDLVLNTERLTVEAGVRLVRDAMAEARFQPTEESRRELRDLSLVALARAALLAHPVTRGLGLQVTCQDGYLTVAGLVHDAEHAGLARHLVSAVPGVAGVRNQIVAARLDRRPQGIV
jgi:cytidylate kinase